MKTSRHRSSRSLRPLALLAGLLAAQPASAIVVVDAVVTPLGSSYRYDVSVTNQEAEDLALVTLVDAPLGDPLISPTLLAPAGFLASYDGGLGLIDLLADSGSFAAGATAGGFQFESTTGPDAGFAFFEALGILGTSFSGTIRTTVVPDAGSTFAALAISSCALSALLRRRLSTR